MQLVTADENEYILINMLKPLCEPAWKIYDFRLSSLVAPSSKDFSDSLETLAITEKARKHFHELFTFPVEETETYWRWFRHNGIIFQDHDFSTQDYEAVFHRQGFGRMDPTIKWTYQGGLEQIRRAKEFWSTFEGPWSGAKDLNPHLRPSGFELYCKLRELD